MEFTITQFDSSRSWVQSTEIRHCPPPPSPPSSGGPPDHSASDYTRGAFTHDEIQHILFRNGQCPIPCRPFCIFFFFLSLFISLSHSAHLVTESRFVSFSRSRDGPECDALDTSGSGLCPPPEVPLSPSNRAHLV